MTTQTTEDIELIRNALFSGQNRAPQQAFFRLFGYGDKSNQQTLKTLSQNTRDIDRVINQRAGIRFCHHTHNLVALTQCGRRTHSELVARLELFANDTNPIFRKRAALAKKWLRRIQ